MTTERLSALQPLANGRSATAAAELSGVGEGSAAFRQALSQRLESGAPAERASAAAPSSAQPEGMSGDAERLVALVERSKVLAGRSAVTGGESGSGKPAGEGGKVLPDSESPTDGAAGLTPEQLAARFMTTPPAAADAENSGQRLNAQAGEDENDLPDSANSPQADSPQAESPDAVAASVVMGLAAPASLPGQIPDAAGPRWAAGLPNEPAAARGTGSGMSLAHAGQMAISCYVDESGAPGAQRQAPEAGPANVVAPDRLAGHARATNAPPEALLPSAGLSLSPDLLEAVASEFAKSGDGMQTASSSVQGAALPLPGIEQAHPEMAGLSQAVIPQTASAAEVRRPDVPAVNTFLGQPGWSDDLGQRVAWLTGRGLQAAELQLNPQHLGPVEVRINMTQDQASIQFVSHHAGVREAIEAAIPKLREMLGAQNLSLAEVSVSQQSFSEHRDYRGAHLAYDRQSQSGRQGSSYSADRQGGAGMAAPVDGERPVTRRSGRGLLSLYA